MVLLVPPITTPITAKPESSRVRWTICALLFFATTINYIDGQVLSVLATTLENQHRLEQHSVWPHHGRLPNHLCYRVMIVESLEPKLEPVELKS